MNKTSRSVVIDYQLSLRYERVRQRLEESASPDRLDKPLAFYASASDRHLPLALIDRTVRDLSGRPLAELYAVPGIGPKKLGSLLNLLERALEPVAGQSSRPPAPDAAQGVKDSNGASRPERISEDEWERRRECVRRHGLGHETLGRYASSLRKLPRTLWPERLDGYLDLTLEELRDRRNYGDKRISAILEVFGCLQELLLSWNDRSHLSICPAPRFAAKVERWLNRCLVRQDLPECDEVQKQFVNPLLEQLAVDGGETHAELVRDRLDSSSRGMNQAARRLGLARGRAYELLHDASEIMDARWPEGRSLVGQIVARMQREAPGSETTARLTGAASIFFRGVQQSADGRPPLGEPVQEPGNLFQAAAFCVT